MRSVVRGPQKAHVRQPGGFDVASRQPTSAAHIEGWFFDSSAASGGDGSRERPYNSIAKLNALSGDQQNRICFLKRGSKFTAPLYLNSVSNLTIDAYGTGADPIICNFKEVSPIWVDYTGTQAQTYYITAANFGDTRSAVIVGDFPCYERSSIADLTKTYERASDGTTHEWTYFYDSSTSRIYIRVPSAYNSLSTLCNMKLRRPQTSSEEAVQLGEYAILAYQCTNIQFKNLQARGGRRANCASELCNGIIWDGIESYWTGNLNNTGQNLFQTKGSSRASPDQNVTITNCYGHDAYGSNNNAVEILFSTGLTIENSRFDDFRGNGVEFWQTGVNVTAKRCRWRGGASMVSFFDQDGDGLSNHNNVLFQNCIYQVRINYLNQGGTGSASRAGGCFVELCPSGGFVSHTNVRIVNCTAQIDDAPVVFQYVNVGSPTGGGSGTFQFVNNVVIMKQTVAQGYAGYEQTIYTADATTRADDWVIDRVAYKPAQDTINASIATTFCDSSVAQMRTAWNGIVGATTNEDNSVQVAASANFVVTDTTMYASDLRPYNGSAAMVGLSNTGHADYPTVDYTGTARSRGSAGAYD